MTSEQVLRAAAARDDGTRLRRGVTADVPAIVALLADDPIGRTRETADLSAYLAAFAAVDADPGELLLVSVDGDAIIGTMQLAFCQAFRAVVLFACRSRLCALLRTVAARDWAAGC